MRLVRLIGIDLHPNRVALRRRAGIGGQTRRQGGARRIRQIIGFAAFEQGNPIG